jgi:phosphoribosylformylglycinamidine synthase subunit PurS
MLFLAEIDVMPLPEILDPQGKAVLQGLLQMQIGAVETVRIGRHITLTIEAATAQEAEQHVALACQKLLANPIMEGYTFTIAEVATA